jgi:hypothetical protein
MLEDGPRATALGTADELDAVDNEVLGVLIGEAEEGACLNLGAFGGASALTRPSGTLSQGERGRPAPLRVDSVDPEQVA